MVMIKNKYAIQTWAVDIITNISLTYLMLEIITNL